MDHTNTSSSIDAGYFIYNGTNIWIKNVRDINSQHKHVWIYQSTHVTVRDSYFYGSWNASSESYGVDHYTAADNLVENNIFQHIAQSMLTEGCTGCVFGHNYTQDDYYTANGADPNWQEPSSWHHSVGDAYILWEGNQGAGFIADDIHGTSHFLTLFRNYWTGLDQPAAGQPAKTEQTTPLILEAYQRYFNVIGNVLGKPGMHTNYQVTPSSTTAAGDTDTTNISVYSLGFAGNEGTSLSPVPNDMLETSTLLRWGNYDTATGTARFVTSEVPSGISLYANPVPSSQVLPPSFYLAAKPAWWGSTPWPAIGPEVAGGTGPGGHAYGNPADVCFQSISASGSAPFTFNANNCYGTTGTSGSTGSSGSSPVVSPVSITTSSLPGGTLSSAYPATSIQAQGGTAPYKWTASGLPAGLALSSAGQLSGTPSASGSFTAQLTVTDSSSPVQTASQSFGIAIVNPVSSGSGGSTATPAISSLSPTNVTAGSSAFTLTVSGSGFGAGAVVQWNGTALTTVVVSSSQLTAAVPATAVSSGGSATVTVSYGGALSTAAGFTINGRPSITSLNPSSATTGGAAFSLAVTGTGFSSGSVVWWNGTALATTVNSATQVTASVPASMIASTGSASITVASGGITSTGSTFTISAGPAISAVNPASVPVQTASATISVMGSGFSNKAAVHWNKSALTTSFVGTTQLTATVPASMISSAGTASVSVVASGMTSNSVSVPIVSTPTVTSLSPSAANAGSAAFVLTVTGTKFASGNTVVWNQTPLATSFVSAKQLKASVPAALVTAAGTAAVSVTAGGAASSALSFTIKGAAPVSTGAVTGSMPQVSSGGNWQTTFMLLNTGTASAQSGQSFFDASGDPLALPVASLQSSSTVSQTATVSNTLGANSLAVVATEGSANQAAQTGSATLSGSTSVGGFALLKSGSQEVAVPYETRNAPRYVIPFDTTGGYGLTLAVQNVLSSAAAVPVVVRDPTGKALGTDTIYLQGNGQFLFNIASYYTITANARGTIEFDTPSAGQISVLAVRTSPAGAMINIPVLANLTNAGGSAPNIASGGGWTTTIVLVNTGSSSAQANIGFFSDSGAPLTLPLSNALTGAAASASQTSVTLAAGAITLLQSTGSATAAALTGSLQMTTTGAVGGYVIFSYAPTGQEASAEIENRGASAYIIPFDQTAGTTTVLHVNNASALPATIPVIARDGSGNVLAQTSVQLPADGHTSISLTTQVPSSNGIRGSVEFDTPAGGQINALGVRTPATLTFTALPPVSR